MPGIYYYIWHKPPLPLRLGNPDLIRRELADIRDLGLDFIIMDLECSLFGDPRYGESFLMVCESCADLGLKILPITCQGSGMLPDRWWADRQHRAYRNKDGNKVVFFGNSYSMDYHHEECYEAVRDHQRFVLDLISPEVRYGVVEVMEDVGYPFGHGNQPDPEHVTRFIARLAEDARQFGYQPICNPIRCGRLQPEFFAELGVDYEGLARVVDGQIGVIAPLGPKSTNDYDVFRRGVKYLTDVNRGKLCFVVLSADRPFFNPVEQFSHLEGLDYTDIVFYSYNENFTDFSDLRTDKKNRAQVRDITRSLRAMATP